MGSRGVLTDEIVETARTLLSIELTQEELRLMPYIQYLMTNEQKIDPRRINESEREILSRWKKKGWIEGGASGLSISKDFWEAINALLWLGYVDY